MRIFNVFVMIVGFFVLSTAVGASDLPVKEKLIQKENVRLQTHIGGIVFKVVRTSPLPNAFGEPDIFGREVNRGFMELRYLGLNGKGKAQFKLIDIETQSNETTMSRTPIVYSFGRSEVTYNPLTREASVEGSAITFGPPDGSTETLPPNTTEFQIPVDQLGELQFGDVELDIKEVRSTSIEYFLR